MAAFPAVVVTGARQVGKTTLVQHALAGQADYVVFDPVLDVENARREPDLFLDNHRTPLVLDENQYAPEVVAALERRIDRARVPGRFVLTGSQQWGVLSSVKRWLALLAATFQWHEVPAFSQNSVKRVSLKPKGYVADTGVACMAQAIATPGTLGGHPLWGALFETAAVAEIRKLGGLLSPRPAAFRRAHPELRVARGLVIAPVERAYALSGEGRELGVAVGRGGRGLPMKPSPTPCGTFDILSCETVSKVVLSSGGGYETVDIGKALGANLPAGLYPMMLFVPSSDRDGARIDRDRWTREALAVLGKLFRGATGLQGFGVWRDDSRAGQLLHEEPVIVFCLANQTDVTLSAAQELRRFLHRLGRETNQGEVGAVIEGIYWGITQFDPADEEEAS